MSRRGNVEEGAALMACFLSLWEHQQPQRVWAVEAAQETRRRERGSKGGMDETWRGAWLLEAHTFWDLSHHDAVEGTMPGMLPSLPVTNTCIFLVTDLT